MQAIRPGYIAIRVMIYVRSVYTYFVFIKSIISKCVGDYFIVQVLWLTLKRVSRKKSQGQVSFFPASGGTIGTFVVKLSRKLIPRVTYENIEALAYCLKIHGFRSVLSKDILLSDKLKPGQ